MRAFTTLAIISRLGTYSSSKATYSTKNDRVYGQFRPIGASMATVALNIQGQAYQFVTEGYKPIQANDKLTIEENVYGVKGVARTTLGGVDMLVCTLERDIKA